MDRPWAALIDLPSSRREPIAAALDRIGVAPVGAGGESQAGEKPPVLVVASFEDARAWPPGQNWVVPDESVPATLVIADESPTASTLRFQLRHGLFNLMPEAFLADDCLDRTLRDLMSPETTFNVAPMIPEAELVKRFVITTLAEKHDVAESISALLKPYIANERAGRDIYLIVNELINNAFFHSFVTQSGSEKYSPRHFSELVDPDRVTLEIAAGQGSIALAVEDNRGTLEPAEVIKYMLRQTSGEGVFDSHGRGFYLISNLVDHLMISLERDKRARISTLTHSSPDDPMHTLNFFIAS